MVTCPEFEMGLVQLHHLPDNRLSHPRSIPRLTNDTVSTAEIVER